MHLVASINPLFPAALAGLLLFFESFLIRKRQDLCVLCFGCGKEARQE